MNVFDLSASLRLKDDEYNKGLDNAESKAKGLGGKLKSAMKVGATAFAAVSTAVIGTGAALKKGISSTAEYGDKVDKMSQKIGISAKSYQQWDYVMQRAGTSIDSMKMGMKTLSSQAQNNAEEFQKLGISQKEVASMSQEELFTKTVRSLAGMEQGTERAALASKLLGRAGADMAPLLNSGTAEIDKQMKMAVDYGMVMPDSAVKASAAFEDSVTTMKMTATGLRNKLMGELLPAATKVTDGLALIFKGDVKQGADKLGQGIQEMTQKILSGLPKIVEVGGRILKGLADGIIQNLPTITNTAVQIVLSIVQYIIQAAPKILSAGVSMINTLMKGVSSALPKLIPTAVKAVVMMVQALVSNAPKLVTGAIALINGLVTGLINAIPQLIDALPKIVTAIVETLIKNAPKILKAGLKLIVTLAKSIVTNIPKIVAAVIKLAIKIPVTILKAVPKLLAAGVKLVKSLWNGIKNWFGSLLSNLGGKVKQIPAKVISFVGKMLSAGVSLIKNLWSGIKSWFSELISKFSDKVKKIPEKVGDFISDIFEAGKDLITGFWDGIKSVWEDLKSWWEEHVGGMGKDTRKLLDENSPSRVFRKIGYMIPQGFALGIQDGWGLVDDAMNDMDNAALSHDGSNLNMGYTNGTMSETVSIAMGNVMGAVMNNMAEAMADSMSDAMNNINVVLDKRQFGKMTRKAVANAL